ncbi:MAG: hypothetical protein RLN99_10485, partial [Kiloniellaceae bacterium]
FGLGYTFEPPFVENLIAFLRRYSMDEHLARRAHILSLPPETFCDLYDTRDLCDLVLGLNRRAGGRAAVPSRASELLEPSGE